LDLSKHAFFEGKIVPLSEAKVNIATHAFLYGTAVFGGMRAYWNTDAGSSTSSAPTTIFRRLLHSARLLSMQTNYDEESLIQLTLDVLADDNWQRISTCAPPSTRLTWVSVWRLHDLKDEFSMFVIPMEKYLRMTRMPTSLVSSWRRIDDNMIPARGKVAGAYVNSALMKSDAVLAGFDEVLAMDGNGHLSEGSAMNIFMVRRRRARHATHHRQHPRGIHAPHRDRACAQRTRPSDRRALHRPHGSLHRRGVLHDRHRGEVTAVTALTTGPSVPGPWVPSPQSCARSTRTPFAEAAQYKSWNVASSHAVLFPAKPPVHPPQNRRARHRLWRALRNAEQALAHVCRTLTTSLAPSSTPGARGQDQHEHRQRSPETANANHGFESWRFRNAGRLADMALLAACTSVAKKMLPEALLKSHVHTNEPAMIARLFATNSVGSNAPVDVMAPLMKYAGRCQKHGSPTQISVPSAGHGQPEAASAQNRAACLLSQRGHEEPTTSVTR